MDKQALAVIVKGMGGELLSDNGQYINRFQIRSETSSSLYTVAQRKSNGQWTCSCRGWIAHNHGNPNFRCKHLRAVVPLLENAARAAMREFQGRR